MATGSDYMNSVIRASAGRGDTAPSGDFQAAWAAHQQHLEDLLDEIESLNGCLAMLEDMPEARRCIDALDDVVEVCRDVVDSTDVVETALGIEDALLEPSDYASWPAEDGEE